MSTTASIISSLHFEYGGVPGSSITEGTNWVSTDITDTTSGNRLTVYIANNAAALQALSTEFHHLAEKLLRLSIEKENILFDEGLPATDINAYPELEVAAAMEVEF